MIAEHGVRGEINDARKVTMSQEHQAIIRPLARVRGEIKLTCRPARPSSATAMIGHEGRNFDKRQAVDPLRQEEEEERKEQRGEKGKHESNG